MKAFYRKNVSKHNGKTPSTNPISKEFRYLSLFQAEIIFLHRDPVNLHKKASWFKYNKALNCLCRNAFKDMNLLNRSVENLGKRIFILLLVIEIIYNLSSFKHFSYIFESVLLVYRKLKMCACFSSYGKIILNHTYQSFNITW